MVKQMRHAQLMLYLKHIKADSLLEIVKMILLLTIVIIEIIKKY